MSLMESYILSVLEYDTDEAQSVNEIIRDIKVERPNFEFAKADVNRTLYELAAKGYINALLPPNTFQPRWYAVEGRDLKDYVRPSPKEVSQFTNLNSKWIQGGNKTPLPITFKNPKMEVDVTNNVNSLRVPQKLEDIVKLNNLKPPRVGHLRYNRSILPINSKKAIIFFNYEMKKIFIFFQNYTDFVELDYPKDKAPCYNEKGILSDIEKMKDFYPRNTVGVPFDIVNLEYIQDVYFENALKMINKEIAVASICEIVTQEELKVMIETDAYSNGIMFASDWRNEFIEATLKFLEANKTLKEGLEREGKNLMLAIQKDRVEKAKEAFNKIFESSEFKGFYDFALQRISAEKEKQLVHSDLTTSFIKKPRLAPPQTLWSRVEPFLMPVPKIVFCTTLNFSDLYVFNKITLKMEKSNTELVEPILLANKCEDVAENFVCPYKFLAPAYCDSPENLLDWINREEEIDEEDGLILSKYQEIMCMSDVRALIIALEWNGEILYFDQRGLYARALGMNVKVVDARKLFRLLNCYSFPSLIQKLIVEKPFDHISTDKFKTGFGFPISSIESKPVDTNKSYRLSLISANNAFFEVFSKFLLKAIIIGKMTVFDSSIYVEEGVEVEGLDITYHKDKTFSVLLSVEKENKIASKVKDFQLVGMRVAEGFRESKEITRNASESNSNVKSETAKKDNELLNLTPSLSLTRVHPGVKEEERERRESDRVKTSPFFPLFRDRLYKDFENSFAKEAVVYTETVEVVLKQTTELYYEQFLNDIRLKLNRGTFAKCYVAYSFNPKGLVLKFHFFIIDDFDIDLAAKEVLSNLQRVPQVQSVQIIDR